MKRKKKQHFCPYCGAPVSGGKKYHAKCKKADRAFRKIV